jgi:hypothetical protein
LCNIQHSLHFCPWKKWQFRETSNAIFSCSLNKRKNKRGKYLPFS